MPKEGGGKKAKKSGGDDGIYFEVFANSHSRIHSDGVLGKGLLTYT
jgi:hypothetical protein